MTTPLDTLIERRASLWEQYQGVLERANGDGFSAEDRQSLDRMDDELNQLSADIDRIQKADAKRQQFDSIDRSSGPADPGERREEHQEDEAYADAFRSFLRRGASGLDQEQRTVLSTGVSNDPEVRAQAVGTGAAGGFLVPPAFRNEFIKTMKDFGAVQRVAQVIETDTGANLQWPTMNDTGNVGALLAENVQMTEQDLTIGTASLDAFVYTSKLTRASYQVVQDSAFDVEATVRDAHAERVARITNQHFTTGTGTAQPDGIVTSAVAGVTLPTGNTTTLTSDGLIDLEHSVDPAYRRSPRARFMLSDTALKSIRKLKYSGSGEYIWQPGLREGAGSTLLGYPYEINQDMAAPAASVKSVLFGDFFAGYLIRIVRGLQVITFTERFADFLQIAWASFMRADGTVQNTDAYKALVQSAT